MEVLIGARYKKNSAKSQLNRACHATIKFKLHHYCKTVKMKTLRTLAPFFLLAMLSTSCDWHSTRTVIGSGNIETMEIELSGFTGINVTGTCNVDFTVADTFSVKMHAQQEVLNVMTFRMVSGMLQIGFDSDYNVNTDKEISATIMAPSLNFVGISGAGDYTLRGSKQAELDIQITGAGNIKAFNMEVDACNIGISGSGNCEVSVNKSLQVNISGVGNVFYRGNPEITSVISGVGNILAAGM